MSSTATTITPTYDTTWGKNGQYSQVFSSFSGLFFAVMGIWVFWRFRERFLGILLIYKGLAAFWNHAYNETYFSLRYIDTSAQLWLLNQIVVWVVVAGTAAATDYYYYYSLRLFAVLVAHVLPVVPIITLVAIAAATEIAIILVVMLIYESYYRRRWLAFGSLVVLCGLLGITFLLRHEPTIVLGQFGMCWVHVTQYYLILGWYIFWSQRHERTLIWGCSESLNAIYCC